MKDFAFPAAARIFAAKLPKLTAPPIPPASPSNLSARLLGDLAMLFDRESRRASASSKSESARLYTIHLDLERLWRMKAASVREGRR